MPRNLYCFELFGFSNIPITNKDKQSLSLKNSRFSFRTITNEDLSKKIESKLKERYSDARVVNLYLIDFIYGKNFLYFAIEFESGLFKNDSNINAYPYQYTDEDYNNLKMSFEEIDELNCTSYFMTDIFMNPTTETFIEQAIIEEFNKRKIEYLHNLTIKLDLHPFLIEISSQYSLDYRELIKVGLKSFFDNNFPRFSERLPINIVKFHFDFILEKEEGKFSILHCKEILNHISFQIGILYSNFVIPHNHFKNQLALYDNYIKDYDQKTLHKLENYLKDLKTNFYDYSPRFFIEEIDENIYNYYKDNELKLDLQQEYPSIDNILKYTKTIFIDFENLKEELKDTIKKINFLKLQKGDNIEKVERLQKEEIFSFFEIASEEDFTQFFFAPLIKAMGFENVKIKGHKIRTLEYGQDVKFMRFRLPTGHFLIFVAQVKKGDIKSSSKEPNKEIERILTEIRPAFKKKVFDDEISKHFKPNHVFLVASGIINEFAKNYLYEQLEDEYKGQLLLLERDKLYDLYNEYGISNPEQVALTDFIKDLKTKKDEIT